MIDVSSFYNINTMRVFFFFFNDTATTEIYTLSLHDALPISRRELRRRLVQRARAPERAELDEHRLRDGRPHAVENLGGERDVLVDHPRLLDERVGHRQVELDGVRAALDRPRRAACVIDDEGLGVAPWLRRARHAHDQHLARSDPLLRAADVLAPDVWLGRGLPQRYREGAAGPGPDPPGDDGGGLLVLHAADVREAPGGADSPSDRGGTPD